MNRTRERGHRSAVGETVIEGRGQSASDPSSDAVVPGVQKLVVTPAPLPIECITGYLHTLCEANGYPRPSFMLTGMSTYAHKNGYRHVDPRVLEAMTGMTRATTARLCLAPFKDSSRSTMRLLGCEVHTSELRMDVFRICPVCIADGGRHEAAWHLKLIHWCSKHRIMLLGSCASCGKALEWNRPALGRCRCGADLTIQRVAGPDCTESLGRLIRTLEAALYGNPESHDTPEEMSQLSHLSIYGLSRLVFVLAARVPPSGAPLGQGRSRESVITVGQLESVARILDDWPGAFQTYLEERYASNIQKDPFNEAFRSSLTWAFHTLDNTSGRTAPEDFTFLKDQVLRFGARYLPRERLLRGQKGQKPMSCRWGTILEAAAKVGMDPRTLAKRVKAGDVPSLEADQHRRNRNFLVDMDWLRKWKLSKYAPVHVRDAAEAIGISVSLLRALRMAGIYEPLFQTARLSSYSEEDVNRFAEILGSLAHLYSNDGTVGGIKDDKVNLRTSKSIEARVQLLLSLKGRHPEMWSVADAQSAETTTTVEIEVYGHRPVIVGRCLSHASGDEDAKFSAVLRASDPPIAANTIDEMINRLVSQGVQERDISLVTSGEGALDEGVRSNFLSAWKDRWREPSQASA